MQVQIACVGIVLIGAAIATVATSGIGSLVALFGCTAVVVAAAAEFRAARIEVTNSEVVLSNPPFRRLVCSRAEVAAVVIGRSLSPHYLADGSGRSALVIPRHLFPATSLTGLAEHLGVPFAEPGSGLRPEP